MAKQYNNDKENEENHWDNNKYLYDRNDTDSEYNDLLEDFQTLLSRNPEKIKSNLFAPNGLTPTSGEFSEVYPLSNGLALKWAKTPETNGDLEREMGLLTLLKKNKLPATKTYGNVFHIQGREAFIMKWMENAKLLDAKYPQASKIILISALLDIDIPTNEAWAFHHKNIRLKIQRQIYGVEFFLPNFRQRAAKLEAQFTKIINRLKKNSLVIGDLQILINSNLDVSIIDPLDVLKANLKVSHLTPEDLEPQEFNLGSTATSKSNINAEYTKIINNGLEMLKDLVVKLRVLQTLSRGDLPEYIIPEFIMHQINNQNQSLPEKKPLSEVRLGGLSAKNVAQRILNRENREKGKKNEKSTKDLKLRRYQ